MTPRRHLRRALWMTPMRTSCHLTQALNSSQIWYFLRCFPAVLDLATHSCYIITVSADDMNRPSNRPMIGLFMIAIVSHQAGRNRKA